MKVLGRSIVKSNNDVFEKGIQRANEDYWDYKDKVVAISDGAGGVGIMADKWAQELVDNIPNLPFKSPKDIDTWVSGFWEVFYEKYSKVLADDPWKIKKFEDEGSLATLSAIWEVGENEFIYQSYGDSALFIYNNKTGVLKIQDNIESINYFGTHPYLINWKTEEHTPEGFYEQKISLKEDEELILATDGIAMYLFGAYMMYSNSNTDEVTESKMLKILEYLSDNPIEDFKEFISEFKNSLASEKIFKAFTDDLYNNKFLTNDDYTLVWIENVDNLDVVIKERKDIKRIANEIKHKNSSKKYIGIRLLRKIRIYFNK